MEKDFLTEKIIGCCFQVHNELDPGFLEKTYHNALKIVLAKENLSFEAEKKFILVF
jgi:GxxExxY protein